MSIRIRPVVMVAAIMLSSAVAAPVSAAEAVRPPVAPISVAIEPVETGGPSGFGLVAANAEGTGVQVLVTGAEPGLSVTIHQQACDAIDGTALVGLVGQLAATGQTQATIPTPLASLTDGAHVIAVHPGFEFDSIVACGVIPEVGTGPAPLPLPQPDDTCAGVPAWVVTAKARLARIQELETLANNAQLAGIEAYITRLATNIGESRAMADLARAETPPAGAAEAHAAFVEMLDALTDAATQLQLAMGGQDSIAVQRALDALTGAYQLLNEVRTSVTELDVRCPG